MKTVLLTGARGFIGAHLQASLQSMNCDLVAVSRSSAPHSESEANNFRWVKADLLEMRQSDMELMLRENRVSHVIHAAWYTDHHDYLVSQKNRDWVKASKKLVSAARRTDVSRLCCLGTCLDRSLGQLEESATVYARAKSELRSYVEQSAAEFAVWARVHFVYGPGDRDGRFVPYLLSQLAAGEAVSPRHGGLRRDYVHVADLAKQIVDAVFSGATGVLDVGTGEAPSLDEIAMNAGHATGKVELVTCNGRTSDAEPLCIKADMTRFRELVGPVTARSVLQGLQDTVQQ